MAPAIFFAPMRTPLIDSDGLMNRQWYLFFQALWMRSGGALGGDDAFVAPSIDPGAAAALNSAANDFALSPQYQPFFASDSVAGEIAELRALVTAQGQMIQDLRQGQVVL